MTFPVILEAQNIRKVYRLGKVEVPALRGAELKIDKGEFVAVLGPSGSGKSTLLHILGGLDKPDSGKVLIEGTDLSNLDEHKLAQFRLEKVGFVFQFYNLIPRLTALRNVELPLALANITEDESIKKAKDIIEAVGLKERLNHRPHELSAGEQQRVAIARALVNDPDVVLADEPTGNLDTRTGLEIIQLMEKLNKERDQTFLIATHDQNIAEASDRIIRLKDGLIEKNLGTW